MMQSMGSQRVRYNLATEQHHNKGKKQRQQTREGLEDLNPQESEVFRGGRGKRKRNCSEKRGFGGESRKISKEKWVWLQSGLQGGWQEAGDFISWLHKVMDSGYRRQDLRFKEDGKYLKPSV